MTSRRVQRLNEQLKREISEVLRREVDDPRIGRPTITDVEVTPDLDVARVFVQFEKDGPDSEGVMHGLQGAAPFIRKELGKALRLRRIPELRFREDRTLERATRIERILREVLPEESEEGEGGAESGGGEETP